MFCGKGLNSKADAKVNRALIEGDGLSADQEISRILPNSKFYCLAHMDLPLISLHLKLYDSSSQSHGLLIGDQSTRIILPLTSKSRK
jgi:hypothetical protein